MIDLANFSQKIYDYENNLKQDAALESIPLEKLYAEAAEMVESGSEWSEEDCLVIALLKWFKKWFQWVNAAPCDNCGNTETGPPERATPTEEEAKHGAGVVEIWPCSKCGGNGRFPRYSDAIKLLETRRGRCGEWCHVMQQLLRSLGRTTRYIWNSEDHVWNEIWSEKAQRWIHVDSCEAAFDKPLTYTEGWGKKMAYVLAFSVGGSADVTKRYVRDPEMQLPRTLINETELEVKLAALTQNARMLMDPVELVEWFERDESEKKELASIKSSKEETKTEEYQPRQSGSSEWVKSRGEDGRK